MTTTVVAQFDSTEFEAYIDLLKPIGGDGKVDLGKVVRALDQLGMAASWAYEGRIWAQSVREEWERESTGIEHVARSKARAKDSGCPLAKTAAHEKLMSWCMQAFEEFRDELRQIAKKRTDMLLAEKRFRELHSRFESRIQTFRVLLSSQQRKKS